MNAVVASVILAMKCGAPNFAGARSMPSLRDVLCMQPVRPLGFSILAAQDSAPFKKTCAELRLLGTVACELASIVVYGPSHTGLPWTA